MPNTYKPEATISGDSGVWGAKELAQNRAAIGINSCKLYDDAGSLKITTGKIGLVDSGYGILEIDTVATITLPAVTSQWCYITASRSGTTPVFTATAQPADTDPTTMPATAGSAYDGEKCGFYTGNYRMIGWVWINAGGNLAGVVNAGGSAESYVGDVEDVNAQTVRHTKIVGEISSIIDSGSDANGYYTKLSDGTMIQYGAASGAVGAAASKTITITFPEAFIDTNYQILSQLTAPVGGSAWFHYSQSNKAAGSIDLTYIDYEATARTGTASVKWHAIGKWR